MTALQKICEMLFFVEETSKHERSIILVNIMNALGFSKNEREIRRHQIQLENKFMKFFRPTENGIIALTGSTSGFFIHI